MKINRCLSLKWRIVIMLLLSISLYSIAAERKQLFDSGWKFYLGDEKKALILDYDDRDWKTVNLPYDWSVEGIWDKDNPMGNDGGYFPAGVGWYRKTFIPEETEKMLKWGLYFEGVYMNSEVFVNGQSVGKYPYGYSSFFYDVTSFLQWGKPNTIAVRVDNSQQKNCRWYSGSGIYRHVWLIRTQTLHIAHWGVGITTPQVTEQRAQVKVAVTLKNENDQQKEVRLQTNLQRESQSVTEEETVVLMPANSTKEVVQVLTVENPDLWDLDNPQLYEAQVLVKQEGTCVDKVVESFGIRSIQYSAEKGFTLNGKSLQLLGGCLHHDNGCLGVAAFDRAEERKVELMKAAGFNAARTSHNLPSEAFLNACDRLGLLVIDEAFDGWRDKKNTYDYAVYFDEWWKKDVQTMVLRDRNHPSIFCWSIGNEVIERKKLEVVTTARKLAEAIKEIDLTRPITSALAAWDRDWEIYDPLAKELDIVGYNYLIHYAESDHKRVPSRVMMQTESYPREAFRNWEKVNDYSYVLGDFVWTSIDYLGESGIGRFYYKGETEGEHYERNHFPWHGAYCGDIDLTGWRKPISHYRELLFHPEKKLYMAVKEPNGYFGEIKETMWSVWPTWESWNWPGHEGKKIDVEIYSRYPKVRLYLNNQLMGEKETTRAQEFKAVFTINYQAGILRVVGVEGTQEDEKNSCLLKSAGTPVALRLRADRDKLKADGQDLSFITLEVVDKDGNVDPNATNHLVFQVKGAGSLAAACNANLKDLDSYQGEKHNAWKGRALAVIRSNGKRGNITLRVTSPGLKSTQLTLQAK